jgi:hypothetical protein
MEHVHPKHDLLEASSRHGPNQDGVKSLQVFRSTVKSLNFWRQLRAQIAMVKGHHIDVEILCRTLKIAKMPAAGAAENAKFHGFSLSPMDIAFGSYTLMDRKTREQSF